MTTLSADDQLIRYNVPEMVSATRAVKRAANSVASTPVPDAPHGSPGDVEAALSRARKLISAASTELNRVAANLALRASLIARADATGDPLAMLIAMAPTLPTFGGMSSQTAGGLGYGAAALQVIMNGRGNAIETLLSAPEQAKYAQLLDEYVQAAASGKSAAQLERLAARLANSTSALASDAYWASRFRTIGRFAGVAGGLLTFYSAYHSSESSTYAGQFASAGLTAALTSNPWIAGTDVVTGGGVTAQVDGMMTIGEDVITSVVTLDSSNLGNSTQNWWYANQTGENGWFWHGMSQTGDWMSGGIGSALDTVGGEGWPFDGDGSINWVPGY
ncbi:MAG TPA: hypothetical protein DCR14_15225 [Acidimicrobiaceae bacterium]|nr:hypothetical protein [Acidimicrobiaceae bacterium]